jgi:serine/threonine-protein kinase
MASEGQSSLARRIFDEALAHPAAQRSAFLAAACQGDPQVAQEVKRLIEASGQAQTFFSEDTHDSPRIGRYVVVRELGRGGMGVVYEAVDPQIGRHVAIKVINLQAFTTPEECAALRDRLFREARSAGALSHPGIVVVYDVGEDNQMAYIAMECVDGPSLHQLLTSGHRLQPAEALDVLRQAAAALDYAHQRGIVHRDVKPANLLLHQKHQVKIADFGIARISFEPKYTMTGTVMGTPDYMSPEQIEAQPTDGRSDQFSLAVMAYELLTGATPFHGGSYASIMHRIVAGPRPSAHTANPALPAAVDEVLNRAMAQLPEQRYPSCAEFVGALETAVRSPQNVAVPIPAPAPVPAPVPLPRRRDYRIAYLVAGVAALVLVLAGAAYYFLHFSKGRAGPLPPNPEIAGGAQPTKAPAQTGQPSPFPVEPARPATPRPAVVQPDRKTTPAVSDQRPAERLPAKGAESGALASSAPKSVQAPSSPPPAVSQPADPVRDLRNAAESGDPVAMDKLGQLYERGAGVPPDPAEAFRWYSKAAAIGQAAAQYHLGTLYEAGMGTARNLDQAVRLYRQAAAGGNPDAQARLLELPAAVRPAPKTPSTTAPPSSLAVSIRVPANVPWTDTGIRLLAGDTVTVTASGMIAVTADGRIPSMPPGGFVPDCAAAASIYRLPSGVFPAPRLPCWSLIGRVGAKGPVLEVGAKAAFQAKSNGKLFLGVNGDRTQNHSGYWTVAVAVERVR